MWREKYLARTDEMLSKWEDELEKKTSLAKTEPGSFLEWVDELVTFGRPHINGLVDAYAATSATRLGAVVSVAPFLHSWSDIWVHIESVIDVEFLGLSEEDKKDLQRVSGEARRHLTLVA